MSETNNQNGSESANAGAPDNRDVTAFWGDGFPLESFDVTIRPPAKPLAILEKLGSSPFERGQFPFIGFLATTYEKVSQFALERAGYQSPDPTTDS